VNKLYIFTIVASLTLRAHADVIYDKQTFDWGACWNALSIYGAADCETADDFETTEDWTLDLIRVWLFTWSSHSGTVIRVDIFENTDAGPGNTLFEEEVKGADMTWTWVPNYFWDPIYEVDIPISGFDIVAGTRYWLGLQTTKADVNTFWCVMINEPDWWSNCYFYYEGTWYDTEEFFLEPYACFFELHGTPDYTAVEAGSFGAIKALYR